MSKLTIVLLADASTHENEGRALHALLYALQADRAGMDVKLIFDGGGVEWAKDLADGNHKMHQHYKRLREKDMISGVCQFCAGAFEVNEKIKELTFLDEDNGHPDIGARMAEENHEVMVI